MSTKTTDSIIHETKYPGEYTRATAGTMKGSFDDVDSIARFASWAVSARTRTAYAMT